MSHLKAIYVFTHDSIGLGEDGPTHEPVEQLAGLRALPNLTLFRPADPNETAEAWAFAVQHPGPTTLVLTRQVVPNLDRSRAKEPGVARGAYILSEPEDGSADVILIGTGSEVGLCVKAQEELKKQGVKARVVSMPSWDLFAAQDESYRDSVLPKQMKKRVAVEAASPLGWHRWTGDEGPSLAWNDSAHPRRAKRFCNTSASNEKLQICALNLSPEPKGLTLLLLVYWGGSGRARIMKRPLKAHSGGITAIRKVVSFCACTHHRAFAPKLSGAKRNLARRNRSDAR